MGNLARGNLRNRNRKMGKVRTLIDKGYGFIMEDTLGSIFFHASELVSADFKELKVGAVVEFKVEEVPQGLKAIRILIVEDC